MNSTRIGLGVLALTLAAGCGKKIAEGPDFTLPIPSGFHVEATPGVLLALVHRGSRANLVVTAVAPGTEAFTASTPALCTLLGQTVATQLSAKPMGSAIVDGPTGKTCRYELKSVEGLHVSGTVVVGPKSTYIATCTSKMDDVATPVACSAAIGGWKFR
jgi:hypothetical protein